MGNHCLFRIGQFSDYPINTFSVQWITLEKKIDLKVSLHLFLLGLFNNFQVNFSSASAYDPLLQTVSTVLKNHQWKAITMT